MIKNVFDKYDYLIDPHTAVGMLGLGKYRLSSNSFKKPFPIIITGSIIGPKIEPNPKPSIIIKYIK